MKAGSVVHGEERPQPPRPLSEGNVVATYCEPLKEWSAAVVVRLNTKRPFEGTAEVVELDWSGSKQPALDDVQGAPPLRLRHHSWNGTISYLNHNWLLPRNYQVIGNVPPPDLPPSNSYASRWRVGHQLAMQRRWDRGDRGRDAPGVIVCAAGDLEDINAARAEVWSLSVEQITSLDCAALPALFPSLASLRLVGDLGTLINSAAINDLPLLRNLTIIGLFGMEPTDSLTVRAGTRIENIDLHNIPASYASAMRKAWKPQEVNGTALGITGARKPKWVEENRDNPLREWDGRYHISAIRYRKALGQYKQTRRAVLSVLASEHGDQREQELHRLGREYALAFNRLDGTRSPFIETEEREELFEALGNIVHEAALPTTETDVLLAALEAGVEEERDW